MIKKGLVTIAGLSAVAVLSGCAYIKPVQKNLLEPVPNVTPSTPWEDVGHVDPYDKMGAQQRLSQAFSDSVSTHGACKIDVKNASVGESWIALECVGDHAFDKQVLHAVRTSSVALPRFRTIVWTPGFQNSLRWGVRRGRITRMVYGEPVQAAAPAPKAPEGKFVTAEEHEKLRQQFIATREQMVANRAEAKSMAKPAPKPALLAPKASQGVVTTPSIQAPIKPVPVTPAKPVQVKPMPAPKPVVKPEPQARYPQIELKVERYRDFQSHDGPATIAPISELMAKRVATGDYTVQIVKRKQAITPADIAPFKVDKVYVFSGRDYEGGQAHYAVTGHYPNVESAINALKDLPQLARDRNSFALSFESLSNRRQ